MFTVSLENARTGKAETLTFTPEHPLYVQGQGWVEAGSAGIGTSIVSRAGPALQVTALTWQKNKAEELASGGGFGGYTVYNLTVEHDHTFFVGTTGGGTWVHNVCGIRPKKVTIPDGNAKGGWQHIEEGHITGVQPGDPFKNNPSRAELEKAANAIVNKGQRISNDPSLPVQTFQDRMGIAGQREQYRTVIHVPSKTVISIFPFRDSM